MEIKDSRTDEERMKIIQEEIESTSRTVSDSEDYQYENLSKIMKKMLYTDQEIESLIEVESRPIVEPTYHHSFSLTRRKTSSENLKSLHSKFTVLNQKAHRFISSLPSQTSVSTLQFHALEDYYHSNNESSHTIRLPSIKKSSFFDPTPLPPDFKINKDLMVISYE